MVYGSGSYGDHYLGRLQAQTGRAGSRAEVFGSRRETFPDGITTRGIGTGKDPRQPSQGWCKRNLLVPGHGRGGVLHELRQVHGDVLAAVTGYNWTGRACSTAVSAGDSSKRCLRVETREVDGM